MAKQRAGIIDLRVFFIYEVLTRLQSKGFRPIRTSSHKHLCADLDDLFGDFLTGLQWPWRLGV